MNPEAVLIFGVGGHAKVVIESLLSCDCKDIHLFDDDARKFGSVCLEYGVLGGRNVLMQHVQASQNKRPVIVAVGHDATRQKIYEEFSRHGLQFTSATHAKSIIASSVKLGQGIMVMAGVVINPDSMIGDNVIINTGAVVEHDCHIANHCHIAPNATLCGGVSVGETTLIGAGAVVLPGVKIGKHCIIGAGAVVTGDIPDYAKAMGVPARIKEKNS